MNKILLILSFILTMNLAHGQQKVIPAWKAGDAWKIKAVASSPSDSKKMDEFGKLLLDTLYQDYIWKVEEETEDGYIMSLQMTGYQQISASVEDGIFEQEMNDLFAGLKNIAPLRYLVKKDGTVRMDEPRKPMEDEPALMSVILMTKSKPVLLNDSIFEKYIADFEAAKRVRIDSVAEAMAEAGEPMPEYVETIDLSDSVETVIDYTEYLPEEGKKKKGKKSKQEEDWADEDWDIESDDEDDEHWGDEWNSDALYVNALKEAFTKRIEMLHTPFGTEIKQFGEAYTVEDFTEQELAQLQLTPDVMKMLKITGTYQFRDQEGILEFVSDISMDMQEFMRMLVKGFEDIFSEDEDGDKKKKKKEKKNAPEEPKEKASDKIPSMDMRMKSVWNLQSQSFVPASYSILVSTSVEEEGVKMSFEAKELILFEKAE